MSDWDNFDEFDAVRDFRATLGTLEPETSDRIRARIVELARQRSAGEATGDHAGLIVLEPTLDLREPDQPPRVPAPTRSLDDASAAAVVELHAARQPSALRPTRLMAAAAAIVVALVVGTVVFRSPASHDTDLGTLDAPTTQASVVTVDLADLAARARAAADTGDLANGAQPYSYTRTDRGKLLGAGRVEQEQELWSNQANEGKLRFGVSTFVPLSGSGPPQTQPGTDLTDLAGARPFADGALLYGEVRSLPADPVGVRDALIVLLDATGPTDPKVFAAEFDLLAEPITPPAVRGAVFDLLRSQGLISIGEATDHDGRTGIGFSKAMDDGTAFTIVIDQASGAPLGYTQVRNSSGGEATQVMRFATYRQLGLADGPP